METVYILMHEYEWCEQDVTKFIGAFATESDAQDVIARLKIQPGFQDWPDGFVINPTKIGKYYWEEGFHTTVNISVPSKHDPDDVQGALAMWRPGDLYEIYSLNDSSTALFSIGDTVRCIERDIDGNGKVLVADEIVRLDS